MVTISPFRGLRPRPELASRISCPPYDVLSAAEARSLAKNEPLSFLRVNKAELEFADSADPYTPEVYQRGKQNLDSLINQGAMARDDGDCFYLYRLTMDGKSQSGLVCLTSVADYLSGIIKKHEHTRPEKVNDRANHIIALNAQVGPVLSAYRHQPEITRIFKSVAGDDPTVGFASDDGVEHQLWVIKDENLVKSLVEAFSKINAIYIADGHHRSEAAAEVQRREGANKNGGANNYFLSVLFDEEELTILPYNRVVRDLAGQSLETILQKAENCFEIASSDREVTPETPHQFGLYCQQKWYLLTARTGSFDSSHVIESIDAAILARNLMSPILGIGDPRTNDSVSFVGGIRGTNELIRMVDSGEYKVAFSLYPTSIKQLLAVADAGEVMPPKSTWFEPKLRSGMVVNLLNE